METVGRLGAHWDLSLLASQLGRGSCAQWWLKAGQGRLRGAPDQEPCRARTWHALQAPAQQVSRGSISLSGRW